MAAASRCDPPRATGQPPRCAEMPSIRPTAAVKGVSSGRIEWAAIPANRPRQVAPEMAPRQAPGRSRRHPAEAHHQQGMARRAERAEHLRQDLISSGDQRLEQPPIGRAVVAQPRRRGRDGPLDDGGPAVLQRVGQGGLRVTPLQADWRGRDFMKGDRTPNAWMLEQMPWT